MAPASKPFADAPAIVWFRDDLRLADHPALAAAAETGRPLLCLYVLDEESDGIRPLGGAARWWLQGSLAALDAALAERGGRLHVLKVPAAQTVTEVASETAAQAVFWGRRYEAAGIAVDAAVKAALKASGVRAESVNTQVLYEPWTVKTGAGAPYRVFSAYWRAAAALGAPSEPTPALRTLSFFTPPSALASRFVSIESLGLEPRSPDWAAGFDAVWTRGEAGAQARLEAFLDEGLAGYAQGRDRPDLQSTSRLSPHLRFGEISPRQVWHAAAAAGHAGASKAAARDVEKLHAELGWREFSRHLLFHHPEISRANMRAEFDRMPWRDDPAGLRAWRRGRTGYPFVDAGMRELWATGWMHNRARMVAASFLTKHLLMDWRVGEAWFWDTLVDADAANNAASWQWVAGSGADAAPFFRVFNPTLQGEKFDPDGDYVRRWAPEALDETGGYPAPIVEHDEARRRALAAWSSIRSGDPSSG